MTWQYMINSNKMGPLDDDRVEIYDELVQACLATGAYCMIDLHNFGHFESAIIGQGGPTNSEFAGFWAAMAKKYAKEPRIVFELMNEPHDVDIDLWAGTMQAAVTAIRKAGATTQMILLAGTYFDSAETLWRDGSGAAALAITNPDGSTTGLVLDIHKYLDTPNSGILAQCITNNVGNFTGLASFLRTNKRQGLISETGASDDPSCMTMFKQQNTFIAQNSDVFLGIVGWAAGNFDASYLLSLTPQPKGSKYVDNAVFTDCLLAPFLNGSDPKPLSPSSTKTTSTAKATKTTSKKTTTKTTSSSATVTSVPASTTSDSLPTGTSSSVANAGSLENAAATTALGMGPVVLAGFLVMAALL